MSTSSLVAGAAPSAPAGDSWPGEGMSAIALAPLFCLLNLIFGIWMVVQGIELRRTGKMVDSAFPEKQPA